MIFRGFSNSQPKMNHLREPKSNLKCEIGFELVVDLVGLGLDLLDRLLHLLPRL